MPAVPAQQTRDFMNAQEKSTPGQNSNAQSTPRNDSSQVVYPDESGLQAIAREKWRNTYLLSGCIGMSLAMGTWIALAVAVAIGKAPALALIWPLLIAVVALPDLLTGVYASRNGDRLPPWWNTVLGVAYCPFENHYLRGYAWALKDYRRKKRGEPPKVIHMCRRVREVMIERYPPRHHTEWPEEWDPPEYS